MSSRKALARCDECSSVYKFKVSEIKSIPSQQLKMNNVTRLGHLYKKKQQKKK